MSDCNDHSVTHVLVELIRASAFNREMIALEKMTRKLKERLEAFAGLRPEEALVEELVERGFDRDAAQAAVDDFFCADCVDSFAYPRPAVTALVWALDQLGRDLWQTKLPLKQRVFQHAA